MRKRLFIGVVLSSMMLVACNGENKPDISNMEKHSTAETTTEAEQRQQLSLRLQVWKH